MHLLRISRKCRVESSVTKVIRRKFNKGRCQGHRAWEGTHSEWSLSLAQPLQESSNPRRRPESYPPFLRQCDALSLTVDYRLPSHIFFSADGRITVFRVPSAHDRLPQGRVRVKEFGSLLWRAEGVRGGTGD